MDIIALITNNGSIELWGVALACFMLFIAGFVDAVAGGGGLISTPAFLFAGLPLHAVIGTNKLANSMGTALVTYKFAKQGFMKWELVIPSVVLALIGSFAGSSLSVLTDETILRLVMLAIIPLAALYTFRSKDLGAGKPHWSQKRTILLCCFVAVTVGFYDGFYGPGTGTFLMLLLTGLARLHVNRAAGVTKAVNLTTNLTALVVFLANGTVFIPLGILAGCFNLIGSYLGANLFAEKGIAVVRPLILVVLALFALRLICELAGIA